MASVALDCLFLAFWVVVQWVVGSQIIERFRLKGLDEYMLLTFQIIFAVSTLIPILVYIAVDLYSIFLQAKRDIEDVRKS